MVKNETKFWREIKKNTPQISWTRVENSSALGTPDLLGYNVNSHFFTLELKVTSGNKIRFSPHQIAFHVRHPNNTFIMVKHLASSDVRLYEGKVIEQLDACGLKLDACRLTLAACCLYLQELGAWCLRLDASFLSHGAPRSTSGVWIPLVFSIWYIFNCSIPTGPAIFALVALVWSWTCSIFTSCNRWCPGPKIHRRLVYHMGAKSYN